MISNNDKLTTKQRRFCEEYMVDFNATQSAIRSGYSKKSAHAIGVENLNKPLIKEELTRLQEMKSAQTEISRDRVIQNQDKITLAYEKLLELTFKKRLTKDDQLMFDRLIQVVKASDSTRASEFLARQLGWESNNTNEQDNEITFKIIRKNGNSSV